MALVRDNPEGFVDGLIVDRTPGSCTVAFLDGSIQVFRVFDAPIDFEELQPGEPVAFHRKAEVLASHERWMSARILTLY